jgi:hypothetical protein
MSRWRAFAIHLGLSVAVIGALAVGLFVLWYPPNLLGFAGAGELLGLVAGVDIIAGPLLTLIVYKAGKKSLKFDLSVIALAQFAFLGIGLWTVWTSRPVYIAAGPRDFEVVFANEIDASDLAEAEAEDYRRLPLFGPVLVSTREPRDDAEAAEVLQGDLIGKPITQRPRFYRGFEDGAERVRAQAKSAAELHAFSWYMDEDALEKVKAEFEGDTEARFMPAASSRGFVLFVLDPVSGRPLRYVGASRR